ncbi:hypothetical protein GA0115256_144114 [Streptomyces sp. DconLS]|nr:hypothetical protein GA0115258_104710 [Streptomyces sp. LamerLS-31b]SCG01771.1 hypothetical protein GA0115256_144114 [Streptomyces sp. DconLS]
MPPTSAASSAVMRVTLSPDCPRAGRATDDVDQLTTERTLLVGRRDQLRCFPAQLRVVSGRIGDDVQAVRSASNFTAWTCPASSGAVAARMSSKCARTLPLAAGATMPRSVIIMAIAAPRPSGSRPSSRTAVPVRRFGVFVWVPPFFFAASRAVTRGLAREVHPAQLGAHVINGTNVCTRHRSLAAAMSETLPRVRGRPQPSDRPRAQWVRGDERAQWVAGGRSWDAVAISPISRGLDALVSPCGWARVVGLPGARRPPARPVVRPGAAGHRSRGRRWTAAACASSATASSS